MAQVQITDFKYGMDRRRARSSGIPGSLWTLKNAHISRGGDIERMKKWVKYSNLPAGTFGLASVFGQLYVFGSADLAAAMPLEIMYQRLVSPDSSAMTEILDTQVYGDGLYVIARFASGAIHHFWKSVVVADWATIGATAVNPAWVVYELGIVVSDNPAISIVASGTVMRLTARVPGTAFTVSATGGGATVIPRIVNVVKVNETSGVGHITIVSGPAGSGGTVPHLNSVIIDSHQLIQQPIPWAGSLNNMATAVSVQINEYGGALGVRATTTGNVVNVIGRPGMGASLNGQAIAVVADAGLVVTSSPIAGGVTAVAAVAQVTDVSFPGVIDGTTFLSTTVNGTVYNYAASAVNKGTSATAYKKRMWSTAGTLLRYSKFDNPGVWIDATAGFIDMPSEGDGAERYIGMARYDANMAIIGSNQIRMWFLDTDPTKNAAQQTLNNTGSISQAGIVQYGDQDVFYLDTPGIRSLKARSGVTTAAVNDVGSGMDSWIQGFIDSVPRSAAVRAVGIIEPLDGRYLLAIDDRIVVLSVFAGSKISAWSFYEPGFRPSAFVRVAKRLYSRDANATYILGGLDGDAYPAEGEAPILVETPFISASDPAMFKILKNFMCACTNVWDVNLLIDPNDESKEIWAGKVVGNTYVEAETPIEGAANLIALRMTCDQAGPATFSSFLVAFDKT